MAATMTATAASVAKCPAKLLQEQHDVDREPQLLTSARFGPSLRRRTRSMAALLPAGTRARGGAGCLKRQ
jgi:hypothetical protein